MIDHSIENLVQKLGESLPPGLQHLHDDLEKNFRAILQSSFARMELVTREEFDVQRAVLAKTRQKLEILEEKIKELEDKLQP